MNFASQRLPITLAAIGGILIGLSHLWPYIVDKRKLIDPVQVRQIEAASMQGHVAAHTVDEGQDATGPGNDAESIPSPDGPPPGNNETRQRELLLAIAHVKRVEFLADIAPVYVHWLGVVLAAAGCILFPVQLLRRQKAEEQAEVLQ